MKGLLKILLRSIGAKLIQDIVKILFELLREKVLPKMKRDHREIVNAALPLIEAELDEEIPKEIAKRL